MRIGLIGILLGCGGLACEDVGADETLEASIDGEADDLDAEVDTQAVVVSHPGQFATLQQAVDATPDGGVLRLAAGTFHEGATIAGKSITIVGRGPQRTALDGANVATPLVQVGPGGGVILKKLSLRTDQRAIASALPNGGSATLVRTVEVTFVDASVAIEGTFDEVGVRRSAIVGAKVAGIALRDTPKSAFRDLTVDCGDPACLTGLLVDNSALPQATANLEEVTVNGGSAGGIAVLGGKKLRAETVAVTSARVFGLGVLGVKSADLSNIYVESTAAKPDGSWGDGIVVWASKAVLRATAPYSSASYWNARAAVSVIGCADTGQAASLAMSNTILGLSPLTIVGSPTTMGGEPCSAGSVGFSDGGGVTCLSESYATIACVAQLTHLGPLEAPAVP